MKIKNLRERENFKNVLEFYGIPVSGTKKVKYNNDYFTGDENDVEFAYKLLNLKYDETKKENVLNGILFSLNCLFFLDHDSLKHPVDVIKKTNKWDLIYLISNDRYDDHFSLNKIKEYFYLYFTEYDINSKSISENNYFFRSETWAIGFDIYNFTGGRSIQSIRKMGRSFFLKYHFINDIQLSLDDFYCEFLGSSEHVLRKQYYSIRKEVRLLKNTMIFLDEMPKPNVGNEKIKTCFNSSMKILTNEGFKTITEITTHEIDRYRKIENKLKRIEEILKEEN